MYLTLRREYETARIQEVNDAPVITVVDPAVPPHKKSRPKRALLVLMALALAGLSGLFWALGAEYLVRARSAETDRYDELRERILLLGSALRLRPSSARRG
jgi:uncharacterized protein involved in exopolysaccharide biosynthesis